jgi:hypothetical protein
MPLLEREDWYCPRCDTPLDPAWYSCLTCGRELEREHDEGGEG